MELENKLKEWGASIVGFSQVSDAVTENLKELSCCITVGVRLMDFIVDQIDTKPTFTYFHHYRSVNFLLDQIVLKGALWISEKGFKACPVAASQTVNDMEAPYSGIFPHKTGAVRSGLGFIGKNALYIDNKYGPRIRLASILTDMPIPSSNTSASNSDLCGECNICSIKCPAGAISGNNIELGQERDKYFDAKKCSEFMNKNFKHIGRGSVCGICIKVCPKGLR